jgi:electron transfer flavoprotein beta subunit
VLAKIVEGEKPDVIVLGKQSIDSDACQTGGLLAELLKMPQATFASKLTIKDKKATVRIKIF